MAARPSPARAHIRTYAYSSPPSPTQCKHLRAVSTYWPREPVLSTIIDNPEDQAPPAADLLATPNPGTTLLLQQLNGQVTALREEVAKLKPSRWIGVLQALLVAATVPLTAGVFSIYSERGNREIELYKQNLALVDRAVDFEKDVRYRQAIISYMRELDGQRPSGYRIEAWLSKNEAELTTRENELLVEHDKLTEASKREADQLNALTDQLTSLRRSSATAELTDDDVVEVAKKVETIELTTAQVEETQEALSRVEEDLGGSPSTRTRTLPKPPPRGTIHDRPAVGSLFIRFSTDQKLSAAEHEAKLLRKESLDPRILFIGDRYVTVAGPYLDPTLAERDQDRLKSTYKRTTMIASATELCPRYLPLKRQDEFLVVVCSPESERALAPAPVSSLSRRMPAPR